MDHKITATIMAAAIASEAILSHHETNAQPHTEANVAPMDAPRVAGAIGSGNTLNDAITLKLIPMNDLLTMPHTGIHLSLKEIRSEAEKAN
jgi:hypothetical protein